MANGAPTNLDLSACKVTATGGAASQTLADLGATVVSNALAIAKTQAGVTSAQQQAAQAASDATTANGTAQSALQTASSSDTKASQALTTANAALPTSTLGKAGGPVIYGSDGQTVLVNPNGGGMAQTAYGSTANPVTAIIKAYTSGQGTSPDVVLISYQGNGTGNNDGVWAVGCSTFHSTTDNTTTLGMAANRWSSIYAGTGTIQTSDANEKNVVGVLGDTAYADSQKLIAAGRAIRKAITVFTFRDGGQRQHVGAIAQQVYSALQAAGLDPASFGIWGQDALTQQVEVKDDDGNVVTVKTQPLLDGNGQQVYRQSLRYDELSMLLIAAGEAEMQTLTSRVAALEAKVSV